jgi:hypothetical protein
MKMTLHSAVVQNIKNYTLPLKTMFFFQRKRIQQKKLNFFLLNIKHEQSLFEYWVEKQFSEGTSLK